MTSKLTGPTNELTSATAHLRVYEPLDTFEDWAQSIILRTPQRTAQQWDEFENERLWQRSLRSVSDPFPHNEPEFFRAIKTLDYQGTEHTRYCPGQLQARSLLAAEQAEEAIRPEVFDLLVPPASRQANAQRVNPDRLAGDLTHLHTRTSSWGIPLSWFALFREEDEHEVIHEGDRLKTVRMYIGFDQAVERLAWAVQTLVAHAPQSQLFEELGALGSWLESFDSRAVIELDYGLLAEIVWPDDSASDLLDGLQALDDGDMTGAAAAYRRLSNRWIGPRHLGRAN
ncbi:hypothetical protein [Glutamicibacter halophytocola]|uniref:DUF8083 domain-containing protein n=1 Tax=Glutamicibacter halophytocola TaxID=1933880 RepID=A0AA95BTS1_9MICC|nr:hypothetical protein [Glutamicibacter halophytocola]ALG27714.1 hypothetical protein AOZ07_01010 [Glutamicibacter halophytocola]UUX59263.1 hypothetical protein NUH22_01065 [Glutamicibacter halophytocola]